MLMNNKSWTTLALCSQEEEIIMTNTTYIINANQTVSTVNEFVVEIIRSISSLSWNWNSTYL